MKFSQKEINDLLISWVGLSIAFILLREGGIPGLLRGGSGILTDPLVIPGRFIIVGSAFVLHELSHKYVAQRYGLWAEYRKWTGGLLLALFLSATGFFLFAAPGAVMIMSTGWITPEIDAKTSLAGPVSNIVVGTVALLARNVFLIGPASTLPVFLTELAFINFILAIFNLLPIPPMDGSKILKYNMVIWGVTFGIALVMFFVIL